MNHEDFETTHEQLRQLLTSTPPAEAAERLLRQEHPPLHVIHGLGIETQSERVGELDALVREKAEGPMPQDYEAYVALQLAKGQAPAHVIDRDLYALGAVERAGHAREAVERALPYVVDLPYPTADRQAVADLLLMPTDAPLPAYGRLHPSAGVVVTPLVVLSHTERDPTPEPASATLPERVFVEGAERPSEERARLLASQLAALDADRHQVRVKGQDGTVQYLAPTPDGGFVSTDTPTWLGDAQVRAALQPMLERDTGASIELVSESQRHHYVVLEGLDARQARELDDHFGANLVLRVGDEHTAVVRLAEEPERALRMANLLRARYPDPPEPQPPRDRPTDVELVLARTEAPMPATRRTSEMQSPATEDAPAAAVERFDEHLRAARRAVLEGGREPRAEQLDAVAAQKMLLDGYDIGQVADAVAFASPGLAQRRSDPEAYAREVVERAREGMEAPAGVPKGSSPDVGGR